MTTTLTVAAYLSQIPFPAGSQIAIVDSSTEIMKLGLAAIQNLQGNGVVSIDATDNNLALSAAKALALGSVSLSGSDVVRLSDSHEAMATLTPTQIGELSAKGIDILDVTDNILVLSGAQAKALLASTLTFAGDDSVSIDDKVKSGGYSAEQISLLAAKGVDAFDSSTDVNGLSLDQALALLDTSIVIAAGDQTTVQDNHISGAVFESLTPAQIVTLSAKGIDILRASDGQIAFTLDQYQALGPISLLAGDQITVKADSAFIENLSDQQLSDLSAKHVDVLSASNGVLTTSVALFDRIQQAGIFLAVDNAITLRNAGTALSALTADRLSQLADHGVDRIDASDDALVLSFIQYAGLTHGSNSLSLTAADAVTVLLSTTDLAGASDADLATMRANGVDVIGMTVASANVGSLAPAEIAGFAARGLNVLDASDDSLTLSLDQYAALGSMSLTSSDSVRVEADVAAFDGLSTEDLAAMHAKGVDLFTIRDTSENLQLLSAAHLAALAAKGVATLASTDNVLILSLVFYNALGSIGLSTYDVVTLEIDAGELANLSPAQIAAISAKGIDKLSIEGPALVLSPAQYEALGPLTLAGAQLVATLSAAGDYVAHLTAPQIEQLGQKGVDVLDVSDDALTLTLAQYNALGAVTLTQADVVTLSLTLEDLNALTDIQLAGMHAKGIDAFAVTAPGASLSVLGPAAFTALSDRNVTSIDVTDDVLTLSLPQVLAAVSIDFALNDSITVVLTAAEAIGMSAGEATAMRLRGVDILAVSGPGAALAGLSATEIAELAAKGIDRLDATDGVLTLAFGQYEALGAIDLTDVDSVTVTLSASEFGGLSANEASALSAKGVDFLGAADGIASLSLSVYMALGDVTFRPSDAVTLVDSGSALASLTVAQVARLSAMGVDALDATDAVLKLSLAQIDALGNVRLNAEDLVSVTLSVIELGGLTDEHVAAIRAKDVDGLILTDSGATLGSIQPGQLAQLAARGIAELDATDGTLKLGLAQYEALGSVGLNADDTVEVVLTVAETVELTESLAASMRAKGVDAISVRDVGAALGGLSATQIAALGRLGVARLDASDDHLTLTAAQVSAMTSLAVSADDRVTLGDSGAVLGAFSAAQVAVLAAKGIDVLDATDDGLTLSLAQYGSLGSVTLSAGDFVTLADPGTSLAGLTGPQITALSAKGIDRVDATDDRLHLSLSQYDALGPLALTASDSVVIGLGVAEFNARAAGQIDAMRSKGIDGLALVGTGAEIAGLTVERISILSAQAGSSLDVLDNRLSLSFDQYNALGSMPLSAEDHLTVRSTGNAILSHGGNDLILLDKAVTGSGNDLANLITGNGVANILSGLGGDDTLTGQVGKDRLLGDSGNDRLAGGAGKDTLSGGSGQDAFVFDTRPNTRTNVDRITDFSVRDDTIWIENSVFTKIGRPGVLKSAAFHAGKEAHDANDRIIFDKKAGALYYDDDGTGHHAKVQIASFQQKNLTLSHRDFLIV